MPGKLRPKKHMKTHAEEKPGYCDHCAESLARRRHIEAQAEERQFIKECAEILPGKLVSGAELPGKELDDEDLYPWEDILRYHSEDLPIDLHARAKTGVEEM